MNFLPPTVMLVINILCLCLLCSSSAQSIRLHRFMGVPDHYNFFYPSVWVTQGIGHTFDFLEKILTK